MCIIIAALSLGILFSLHHEVVGTVFIQSSHHRSYSHHHTNTLYYTILTCINNNSSSSSGSGSSSGSRGSSGSESCIIVLYRCIDIDVCYNSSSQSYDFKFSSSRSGRI